MKNPLGSSQHSYNKESTVLAAPFRYARYLEWLIWAPLTIKPGGFHYETPKNKAIPLKADVHQGRYARSQEKRLHHQRQGRDPSLTDAMLLPAHRVSCDQE